MHLKNFLYVVLADKKAEEEEMYLMRLHADELLLLVLFSKNELCIENEGVVFFLVMR